MFEQNIAVFVDRRALIADERIVCIKDVAASRCKVPDPMYTHC